MKHGVFTILSAFLLLLCVATLAIWVRSYWVSDRVLPALSWIEGFLGMAS